MRLDIDLVVGAIFVRRYRVVEVRPLVKKRTVDEPPGALTGDDEPSVPVPWILLLAMPVQMSAITSFELVRSVRLPSDDARRPRLSVCQILRTQTQDCERQDG